MDAILDIRQVSKPYGGGRGVERVSLQIFPGEVYGLLGPNGAGKTTLLKIATGLIRPSVGTVSLFGHPVPERFEQAMRWVGAMIESADFYDSVTAEQYLRMVRRYSPEIPEAKVEELLESVGLQHVRSAKIRTFSTGMKQRLALAAALLPDPKLVLLDEPTNGLDIEGIVLFRELVRRLVVERGTSFIISSHMIHELEQLCSRVGIMLSGRLTVEGRVSELLNDGKSLEQFYIDRLQHAREGKPSE